jgi:palmitoyl-protein thioesterase
MAILGHLRLLVIGSLITASIAKPFERRVGDGDEDDTPLPLVIWHGKRTFGLPRKKHVHG